LKEEVILEISAESASLEGGVPQTDS